MNEDNARRSMVEGEKRQDKESPMRVCEHRFCSECVCVEEVAVGAIIEWGGPSPHR